MNSSYNNISHKEGVHYLNKFPDLAKISDRKSTQSWQNIKSFTTESKISEWAGRMALQEKMLPPKPDNLSSIPRTHRAEGENKLPEDVLSPPACRGR